ncbi:MAG: cytochrome C oxidase subunit IV family protein [Acidobacteria bacterium]|nr:cytochrome C oxidase subunit IV family protein [Acidobacteriota bacterium]
MGTYFAIFAALMVLTALTVWVAFQDFGSLNVPIAFAIATVKATVVVLFFMHVIHSPKMTAAILVGSIVFLGILFLLTFSDYLSRFWPMA